MSANTELVKEWVAACNGTDYEIALALCDPGVELVEAEALPGAVTATGIDEVRRYLERFQAHWSGVEWVPQSFEEDGGRVLMQAKLKLTGRRSGIDVDRDWVYVFTLRDGKLLRQEGFDRLEDGRRAIESDG